MTTTISKAPLPRDWMKFYFRARQSINARKWSAAYAALDALEQLKAAP